MDKKKNPDSKQLEIKKYPNRRYYDLTRSRHVTLEEIHSLVREGYEVQVTASKTGEDITAQVLTQIMLDLDPAKLDVFSVPMLHRLMRANEPVVREFIDQYLNRALNMVLNSERNFESYLRRTIAFSAPSPPFRPRTDGFDAGGGMPSDQESLELREKMGELQAQIEALQQTLSKKQ